jgi:OPT family oligopeptide transporter
VHVALNDGKLLVSRMRFGRSTDQDDPNMRAMRNYPEVPEWWYQLMFVILFAVSIVVCVVWPTFLPWWGFILTMLLPIIFILPIGIIQARTNQQIGLNVITEFVAGYIWPGKPVANTLVKIFGYMAMFQGLLFVQDLKMGVYLKVPPRAMFRFQVIGSFVSNFTSLGKIYLLDVD